MPIAPAVSPDWPPEPPEIVTVSNGAAVTLRPLCRNDVERLRRLFFRLSPTTVYNRFFLPLREPPDECLARLADVDLHDRYAIAALVGDAIIGVARYARLAPPDGARDEAEVAIVVEDAWQGLGLGRLLLARLTTAAVRRGVASFQGTMLAGNRAALRLTTTHFGQGQVQRRDGEYQLRVSLNTPTGLGDGAG